MSVVTVAEAAGRDEDLAASFRRRLVEMRTAHKVS